MSFALLLGGALVFTNAVEWAGSMLGLGQGAVGSILAAVATALPETLIPVVAIISGSAGSGDVAVGAIIGAPFLLATLAMGLIGLAAFAYRGRRRDGVRIRAHQPTFRLDLVAFLAFFGAGLAVGLVDDVGPLRELVAIALLVGYAVYVVVLVRRSGEAADAEDLSPLYLDRTKGDPPHRWQVVAQLAGGLGAIVLGARLFVTEVEGIAESAGVPVLVLALIIAPLATELPEKINSFLWVRDDNDILALGNVTGAMVFQSAIPISVGLLFTDWDLGTPAILASALALAGGALALYAGAYRRRFGPADIAVWLTMFVGFVIYIVLTA